jgi:RimJ/RimL family protein N-acetyltransferase
VSSPSSGDLSSRPIDRSSGISLRDATSEDAEFLFEWANDHETRLQSFVSEPIAWRDHEAWLTSVLADQDRRLFVAVRAGEPVGQVRLDHRRGSVIVSVSVAPQARGRSLAAQIIRLATAHAGQIVLAEIKETNLASIRAFEKAGYVRIGTHSDARGEVVTYSSSCYGQTESVNEGS